MPSRAQAVTPMAKQGKARVLTTAVTAHPELLTQQLLDHNADQQRALLTGKYPLSEHNLTHGKAACPS